MIFESKIKSYRNDITGLRAVAVLLVVNFHLFPGFIPNGYLGVDIFFVISGFVVTRSIIGGIRNKSFRIQDFYRRRILRLFPVFFLVIIATYTFCYILLTPKQLKEVGQTLISIFFFSQNIYFYRESSYFDAITQDSPLLHTWSLAVEEQFYFLIPIVLILIFRKNKRGLIVLPVFFFFSLFASLYFFDSFSNAVFYLLPFRTWQLLLGVMIALLSTEINYSSKNLNLVIRSIGFSILILILVPQLSNEFTTLELSILASISTACIILATKQNSFMYKILSTKFLQIIGAASYSIYLVHNPLIALINVHKLHETSKFDLFAILIGSIVVGIILRRYVEKPFQNQFKVENKIVFILFFSSMSALLIIGLVTNKTNGFESYYFKDRVKSIEAMRILDMVNKHTVDDISERMLSSECFFNSKSIPIDLQLKFDKCYEKYGPAIILIGDSHAISIYNVLKKNSEINFLFGFIKGGCRPYSQSIEPGCFYPEIKNFIFTNSKFISVTLFHQSGSYFIKDENMRVDSNLAFKKTKRFFVAESEIKVTSEYLKKLNTFTNVSWLGPYIESRIDLRDSRNWREDLRITKEIFTRFDALDSYLTTNANFFKDKNFLFKYHSLIDDFKIRPNDVVIEDCLVYNDTDHFTECGETILYQRTKTNHAAWLNFD